MLPCMNKSDDDDDDDEGEGGVDRNSRNSVYIHIMTQSPNHKTNKKNDISKQLSKQAIRQGKLREITKCLLTRFS